MSRGILRRSAVLVLLAAGQAAADGLALAQIPQALPASYKNVRDASRWLNPYLVVEADCVSLQGQPGCIEADELAEVLAGLPAAAWPYGRVIALRQAGVGKRLTPRFEAVKRTLEQLRLAVVAWPST